MDEWSPVQQLFPGKGAEKGCFHTKPVEDGVGRH